MHAVKKNYRSAAKINPHRPNNGLVGQLDLRGVGLVASAAGCMRSPTRRRRSLGTAAASHGTQKQGEIG